jgi:polysaccharide pyruvyl transferase WcaK-like protein
MKNAAPADEILLITRIRTLNKGNQALSVAWQALLERAFPTSAVRILERRPRHLIQYRLSDLAAARDPYRAFDELTTKIAKLAPGPALVGPPPRPPGIVLDETVQPPARFVALRQRLNLRGLVAKAGFYADEYRRRLSACQRARLVVVNPAGEFFPREPAAAFYHLLDADVARKLGTPTAMVNHTMDITDPTLRAIIPRMYRELTLVGFRDQKSVVAFREMGGDMANVVVTPDLALATEASAQRAPRAGTIGLAINVPEAAANNYLDGWERAVGLLLERGFHVELISNEFPSDLPFYRHLTTRFPKLRIAGEHLGHQRYCELLATYELVVTSRMHTAILSMVSGTPVIPVEGASFKITGLFRELGFEMPVVQPTGEGWPARVVEAVGARRSGPDGGDGDVTTKLASARTKMIEDLLPRLQAAAVPTPRAHP